MLAGVQGGEAVQVPLEILVHPLPVLGVQPAAPVLRGISDLVLGIAEHALPARGIEHRPLFQIPVPDAVPRPLQGEMPAFLALAQGLLRALLGPAGQDHAAEDPRQKQAGDRQCGLKLAREVGLEAVQAAPDLHVHMVGALLQGVEQDPQPRLHVPLLAPAVEPHLEKAAEPPGLGIEGLRQGGVIPVQGGQGALHGGETLIQEGQALAPAERGILVRAQGAVKKTLGQIHPGQAQAVQRAADAFQAVHLGRLKHGDAPANEQGEGQGGQAPGLDSEKTVGSAAGGAHGPLTAPGSGRCACRPAAPRP